MESAGTLNQLFAAHLDNPDGKEKLAAVAQAYIRDKLRENSFMRKILPPQMVTKNDMQVSVNHDTLVYIDEIEPQSRAMTLTFRGQPTARFIRASKYEIPVFTVSSERFEKTEQELLAYRMPITKVIEDNSEGHPGDEGDADAAGPGSFRHWSRDRLRQQSDERRAHGEADPRRVLGLPVTVLRPVRP